MNNIYQAIRHLCADLGKDRLLVQGAGGNVSWKEAGVLWIKGSGTWLANADKENIFVPVDLTHLKNALSQANFEVQPRVIENQSGQNLRPSIETILHGLMPQKIVVHLHAIDVLSHLVTKDCKTSLQVIFDKSLNAHQIKSVFVDYQKPGPELAQAIQKELDINACETNIVLLKNHGIVLGAESVEGIYFLLDAISKICPPKRNYSTNIYIAQSKESQPCNYLPFNDSQIQALAFDPELYKRLQSDWVLFPDHAVFLGAKAFTYNSWEDFLAENFDCQPELVFIKGAGVFITPTFNQAKSAQLLCYFDVISRVLIDAKLDPLDSLAVSALLNWDAEKYRSQIAK